MERKYGGLRLKRFAVVALGFERLWAAESELEEDLNDLKLLRATRGEESIAFEEYLKKD